MGRRTVSTEEWNAFWTHWNDAVKEIPGMKKEMLEAIGMAVRLETQDQITRSGLNDAKGRVRFWQDRHIGSKLGYVAVRPDSVEVVSGGGNKKPVNFVALTNYLNSGHKIRGPSGRSERYKPKIKVTKVRGFYFYRKAARKAKKTAMQEAENFLKRLEVTMLQ